jgi:hypothetical protein
MYLEFGLGSFRAGEPKSRKGGLHSKSMGGYLSLGRFYLRLKTSSSLPSIPRKHFPKQSEKGTNNADLA